MSVEKHWRTRLTGAALRFMAALPPFTGGPIKFWQDVVKANRSEAKEAQDKSRAPDGVDVRFKHFRLVELFALEEVGGMFAGLQRLFDRDDYTVSADYIEEFEQAADGLDAMSWSLGGTIVGPTNRSGWMGRVRSIADLPEEISYITIKQHKILPSLFAISADVYLTPETAMKPTEIQARLYYPEVTFYFWNPLKWMKRHDTKDSYYLKQQAVVSWMDDIRARAELVLRRFIAGHFFAKKQESSSVLPVIETFYLRGVPFGSDFWDWSRKVARWWRSLGFDMLGNSFYGAEQMLSWNERTGFRVARLCLPEASGDTPNGIVPEPAVLDEILPAFAIRQLVDSLDEDLKGFRRGAYERLMFGAWGSRFGREIRNMERAARLELLIRRLSVEYRLAQEQVRIRGRAFSHMIRPSFQKGLQGVNLDFALAEGIDEKLTVLTEHGQMLAEALSNRLSILNMRIMYRLQNRVLVLTLIYTVLALLAVVAVWPQLTHVWEGLRRYGDLAWKPITLGILILIGLGAALRLRSR